MSQIKIGWAQVSVTPDRPVFNGGQIYPRVAKYVHDPVTATALALDNGEESAIMMSMDLMCPPGAEVLARVRKNLSSLEAFDPLHFSVSTTHTHNAPYQTPFLFTKDALDLLGEEKIALPPVPEDIIKGRELDDFFVARMTEAAVRAWNTRAPGGVSAASDYAAISFNRRPVFEKDGVSETVMYGVCSRDDFSHYEGTVDHAADMLYTWSPDGKLTGVVACVPCPSQVFELHSFITADYWHYTRIALREKLGSIYVLPLCGAAGDSAPLDLTRISKTNARELEAWGAQAGEVFRNFDMADECRDIAGRIVDAVMRGLTKARCGIDPNPAFKCEYEELQLPIRQVTERDYLTAKAQVEAEGAKFSPEHPMEGADLVRAFEPMGVVSRYCQQVRSPMADVPMHYLRIGDTALVTCPFELFVEFSLRIKARAKSPRTVVVQLTDLYQDYLPTATAVAGGSYSSAPASTTCGPESGAVVVETALKRIRTFW